MQFVSDPRPFLATGLLSVGGGEASSNEASGIIEIEADDSCTPQSRFCNLSILSLVSYSALLRGVYTIRDVNGMPTSVPFTVADLNIRLLQPIDGEFNLRSGVVSFPMDGLYLRVSAGEVILDGSPVTSGSDEKVFFVDGVRGIWNGQQLTLDINWSRGDVSLWLHLTTG